MSDLLRSHVDLLILAALQSGPAHGYAIIEDIRERSQGDFTLPEGTIYPALHALETRGLLASEWQDVDGRRRRVYRLTARGVATMEEKRDDWTRFAAAMRAMIGAQP